MASISPTPSSPLAAEDEELLRSPPSASAPLIADRNVASGSYRRPSLPSPVHSFRSVTACSPLSSPDENDNDRNIVKDGAAERNGRRSMLRSGTSGSITPLSAHSPEAESSSKTSADDRESAPAPTIPSPTACTTKPEVEGGDSIRQTSTLTESWVRSNDSDSRPALSTRPSDTPHSRPMDLLASSSRSDGLLSVPSTPAATDLYRTLSQISIASDADGYFTARPGSPVEAIDQLSLSLLRSHPDRARSALRRERVSQSGHSYYSAPSDYLEPDLAPANICRVASLSIGDEACYVDGEQGLSSTSSPTRIKGHEVSQQLGPRCVDFLWDLPPELTLCILYLLDSHKDLLAVSHVSRRWRAFAINQFLWRDLFFKREGWAIREDAPLVIKHQDELQRLANKAERKAKKEEAERLRRIQEQRKAASTSSPYLDRLAALKSWRENLHIPSFPQLAGLKLSGTSTQAEVDVDTGRPVTPTMSPMRSPSAASGRFGLFLSPSRPAPSTPAGTRRAIEASLSSSYFGAYTPGGVSMSRHTSADSMVHSRRPSAASEHYAEVAQVEEFFAESLNWRRLYRDRYILEQRWMRPQYRSKTQTPDGCTGSTNGGSDMTRTASTLSNSETTQESMVSSARPAREKSWFEPSRRWLRGHTDSVYCVRQDDGLGTGTCGKIVSGSRDCTVRVWDAEMGETKHILTGHTASVLALQYDDRILVSVSSDGKVFVWDFASILASMTAFSERASSTAEGGLGPMMVDGESGALVHDRKERLHCVLREHTSAVLDVVFDDKWIVTGSKDATVRVWRRSDIPLRDPATNAAPSTRPPNAWRIFAHIGPVNAVDLQGNQLVSASGEGSMFLWDLETGEKKHTFNGHTKGLACLAFKGTTLISGSNDQTIRVWDTVSGRCTHILGDHQSLVRTVAYCPARRLVISGGYDRVVKLWRLDEEATARDGASTPQLPSATPSPAQPVEEEPVDVEASHGTPAPDSSELQSQGDQEDKPLMGKSMRDLRCHRARIFDVDLNSTRIVSASEDHLICITNFGGQGINTSLFA